MPSFLLFHASADVRSSDLVIAEADSPVQAIRQYGLQVGIRDAYFIEYAYSSVFRERFYAGLRDETTGHWILSQDYARSQVRARVAEYFEAREDFATRFMDYTNHKSAHVGVSFPDEMLLHIWLHEYAGDLEVVDVEDIPHIAGRD